ncbi:hypothetical protein VM_06035 [Vibrio mimicus]|nr:hypothetical protein VM_06035 [Vibrio mimicus]
MHIEFNTEIMHLGRTCQTCFKKGYRGTQSRIRYIKKPNGCVRCKAATNQLYYKNAKENNT